MGDFQQALAFALGLPTQSCLLLKLSMQFIINGLRHFDFGDPPAFPVTTVLLEARLSAEGRLRGGMLRKEAYLDRVVGEVEELAARVALLKARFAKQKVSVRLEHYRELEYVRTRFAEFKRRVRDLEDADDLEMDGIRESVEVAWKDLLDAVETLLAALP